MSNQTIKLGEIVDFIRGVTFDKSQQQANSNASNIPVLRAGNIQDSLNTWNDLIFVPREIVSDRQLLRQGDIVICLSSGSQQVVGKTAPLDHNWLGTVGGFCGIIRPKEVEPVFLALWLRGPQFLAWRDDQARGANIQNLRLSELGELEIQFSNQEKQRQIAARLKTQLAEVDKARQAAEAQLRDAQALYAAILKETFFSEASKRWPRVGLGEVGEVVAGITLGRTTNGKATRSIPYLRVANVKDGYLDLSDVSTIEATEAEIDQLRLQPGDILLTEGGDPDKLGRGTFWNDELKECIHQNHIYRVRFPADSYQPEFIAAQIGSTYGKEYFFEHAKKTTGIATINQKVLKGFPVLSPTIEVQKSVMNALNCRLDEAGKIMQSATKQLTDINVLPQKILAQAFEM